MNALLPDDYHAFVEAKIRLAPKFGFEADPASLNPNLKLFCAAAIGWALRGGRRAIFASFGLHKTAMQIEMMRVCGLQLGGPTLIVLPLGVRHEFFRDAALRFIGPHAVRLKFIRRPSEIEWGQETAPPESGSLAPTIHLANYETIRDGKLDPKLFAAASLDEASCLRGFGGSKTFREFMRLFDGMRFKFVATATPSPNEYIELLAYAAFLEIMDVGEAKTRFFKRDSEQADAMTLHPHKEEEFWLWVASWALFIDKPSDLGFSDEGYIMPELDLRWHEIPTDHGKAGVEKSGQGRLFRESRRGLSDSAAEKRDSIPARIAKLMEIRAEEPKAHRVVWHMLEAERRALEKAIPSMRTLYGAQEDEEKEAAIVGFSDGLFAELGAKPSMAGSGCNFQRHCHWGVALGIDDKFNDLIQAIHRIQRFGQPHRCRFDIIHTEAERGTRRNIEEKWRRHNEQRARMTEIIRKYGLNEAAMAETLGRAFGVKQRIEVHGENFTLVNNDNVAETRNMAADSAHLILTSIPFSTQYEYTPNYCDFGHTDDDGHFWRQMDFLTPELLRVLQPGRVAAIHVKDRITPGGINGLGFQTVNPFSDDCIAHFRKHGFAFLSRITIVTDVVRENNQTYRLGWSEQCKDGSRMGNGMPEYLLIFRKPPTDRSNGYADVPVKKDKKLWVGGKDQMAAEEGITADYVEELKSAPLDGDADLRDMVVQRFERMGEMAHWDHPDGYSRARWQLDAHGFRRSSGNRLLAPEDLVGLKADEVFRLFREFSQSAVYDFEHHVRIGEALETRGALPPTFMLLPPQSWHPEVWTDVTRMLTLNGQQHAKGKEMHLCPLQFDIVDRAIAQYTMPGETVFDPFGGLMTVPFRALKAKRKGVGIELNPGYFLDGAAYCEAAAREMAVPDLFDAIGEVA